MERFTPFNCTDISKNYAFAIIGYHKIVQRHLMNLSDECLLKAFCRTPNSTPDEQYCGAWDNVDLSKDSFPRQSAYGAQRR